MDDDERKVLSYNRRKKVKQKSPNIYMVSTEDVSVSEMQIWSILLIIFYSKW